MMQLIDTIKKIINETIENKGLTDLVIGTVTKVNPLEITIDVNMLPIPQEVIYLTESVIEKKIRVDGHIHTIASLAHNHTSGDGSTGNALTGSYNTETAKETMVILENGQVLPVQDGYIIINKALAVNDKVLMLRVLNGQGFIVISRVF